MLENNSSSKIRLSSDGSVNRNYPTMLGVYKYIGPHKYHLEGFRVFLYRAPNFPYEWMVSKCMFASVISSVLLHNLYTKMCD